MFMETRELDYQQEIDELRAKVSKLEKQLEEKEYHLSLLSATVEDMIDFGRETLRKVRRGIAV
jgi:hypothetical protein